jgi:GT2 family glycosyltransferase
MISVIICSRDEAKFAAVKTMYAAAMGDAAWEMIGIHDARSLAEGYNRAVQRSRGQIVVFSHDDVEVISPDLPQRIAAHLANFDLIGVAGTDYLVDPRWQQAGPPHIFGQVAHPWHDGKIIVNIFGAHRPVIGNIQALDGLFMAARRSVVSRFAFDAINFDGFHCYDVDFSMQVSRAGLRVGVVNDINLVHDSVGNYDAVWRTFGERFARKWKNRMMPPSGAHAYQVAVIQTDSRAQALEIMTPPYWRDEQ